VGARVSTGPLFHGSHFSAFPDFALRNCPVKPTAAVRLQTKASRLIDVRICSHHGLRQNIAPCPKEGANRRQTEAASFRI
jgi:hypothetical protein